MRAIEGKQPPAELLIRMVHRLTRVLIGRGGLNGTRGDFDDVLDDLMGLCGASTVVFARIDHRFSRVALIATRTLAAGGTDGVAFEDATLARCTQGRMGQVSQIATPRGTVHGMMLEEGVAHTDVLAMNGLDTTWLDALAVQLPEIWGTRQVGLIEGLLGGIASDGAILGAGNPFGLTRAELGVCHHLRDGLGAKDIAATLDVSMPTVRTHLRNIYAKTGSDGMVAVVHRLHTDPSG